MEPVAALLLFATCVAAHPQTVSVVGVQSVVVDNLQITQDLHTVSECDVESCHVDPEIQAVHVRSASRNSVAASSVHSENLVPLSHVVVQDLHCSSRC